MQILLGLPFHSMVNESSDVDGKANAAPASPVHIATPTHTRGSSYPPPSATPQSPTAVSQSQRARLSPATAISRDAYRPAYVSTRIPGSSRQVPRQTALSSPSSVPSTPDITADSISSVLDRSSSFSPQTPETSFRFSPEASSTPIGTSSSTRRGPRYHHSSDTPLHLRASPAFPALPFTFDGAKQQRVRFLPDSQSNTRSMPKLSNNRPIPPPSRSRPSLPSSFREDEPSQEQTDSSSAQARAQRNRSRSSRRKSADVSAEAARSPTAGTWQRRVAEEMVRLSVANFNTGVAAPITTSNSNTAGKRPRSRRHTVNTSADLTDAIGKSAAHPIVVDPQPLLPFPKAEQQGDKRPASDGSGSKSSRPKSSSRRAKENNTGRHHQKLDEMFSNIAQDPVQVHVVQEDSHPDAGALASDAPWRLHLDIPTPSLGLSQTPGEDGPIRFVSGDKKKDSESSDSTGAAGPVRRKVQRRRPRPNSDRERKPKSGSLPAESGSGPSSTRLQSLSTPSLRSRAATAPSSSRQTTPVRPSASANNLAVPPQTPPRSGLRTPVTAGSSPGDSPTPSRHRLSSYAVDPRALFFTPRADPPEGYVQPPQPSPSKPPSSTSRPTSSYFTAPQPSSSSAGTPRPVSQSMSMSNQPEEQQEKQEEAQTQSTNTTPSKNKGKRRLIEDEDEMDVPPLPETPVPSSSLLPTPFPQRQRLESNLTHASERGDELPDLPVNPRKRMKLSSSAALVQSLADAAAAQDTSEEGPSTRPGEAEIRGILRPGSAPLPEEERNASRASSRSHTRSVSFTAVSQSSRARSRRSRSMSGTAQNGRNSIPFLAIISPRPVSLVSPGGGRNGAPTYHLREPRRYRDSHASDPRSPESTAFSHSGGPRSVSDVQSHASPPVSVASVKALPPQGWAFFLGFVFPFSWWIAALWPIYSTVATDGEQAHDVQLVREKYTWRRRCRLIAVFSILIYIPVIVLAVIFGR